MALAQAGVAQLVEYKLPKLGVAGSSPVARSREKGVRYLFKARIQLPKRYLTPFSLDKLTLETVRVVV